MSIFSFTEREGEKIPMVTGKNTYGDYTFGAWRGGGGKIPMVTILLGQHASLGQGQ